jgi:hypothetical protein
VSHDDKRVEAYGCVDDEFIVRCADERWEPARFARVDEEEYDVGPLDDIEEGGVVFGDERCRVVWHWDCQGVRVDLLPHQ